MNTRKFFLLCGLFSLVSCDQDKNDAGDLASYSPKDALFTKLDPEQTGIHFTNKVENTADFNIFRYRNFYNGAGVGIADLNNDGLPDVYLTSNMGPNKLYLNQGDFRFKDITETSGTAGEKSWSTGVTMVDINQDGWLDIYVSNAGNIEGEDRRNELFINNGDLTFTEAATTYQLDENGFTTHAAFFDYDGDGDLDVYLLNNSFIPVSSLGYTNKRELRSEDWDLPEIFRGGGDKLLRNDNGNFTDVSQEAGIYGSLIGFGLGVTIGDVNQDHLPDIYVSNDFYERDYLYINQGDGRFKEEIRERMDHLSLSSMGADMADINNDGKPEIFVTDMLPENDQRLKNTSEFERYDLYKLKERKDFYHQFMQNTLQLNNGDGSFSEIGFYSGVAQTDWSWGALIFDMDNDGYKDIYVSNGIYHDLTNQDFMDFFANDILQEMVLSGKKKEFDSILSQMPSTPIPNYAFRNKGNLQFHNTTKDWGLHDPGFSNGSAYGDLDQDGDLDLIVSNVNGPLFLYRNNSEKTGNNHLQVRLEGSQENPFAIGARVVLYGQGQQFTQELIPTRGFQSSIDYVLTFGLGRMTTLDSLRVVWPDQKTQTLSGVKANQLLSLRYTDAGKKSPPASSPSPYLVSPVEHLFKAHKEDHYVDYDYEGLIPKMLSREGPALATADVDGDGNEDLFIGGARNQPGVLYLQTEEGRLTPQELPALKKDKGFEDSFGVFADVNGDGLPDLIVGSGGNFATADPGKFATRLYLNQGNGRLADTARILPGKGFNTAVIAPHDYDQDGDVDLFIGSRSVPGVYGIDPDHVLLENDGQGNFRDVTQSKGYALYELGMVTAATWEDITGDGTKELVVIGDWMAPKLFQVGPGGLEPLPSNLEEFPGAWSHLATGDLDNDGRPDLILGNRGTNSFYQPGEDSPVRMYINDFDNNGSIEQILTRPIGGKDVPVHLRRELSGQISSVKKQNLRFSEYARRSIEELFPGEVLQNSLVREISTFKSLLALNRGDGQFELIPLPGQVQFSSVHASLLLEEEGRDKKLLLAGNDFEFKPQFGRLDANHGLVLDLGDIRDIRVETPVSTGFSLRGSVRALRLIRNASGDRFIVAGINDQEPKLFRIKE